VQWQPRGDVGAPTVVAQMAYVRARGRLDTGAAHVWQTVGGGSSECYMRRVGEQRAPGSAAAA
jgi:hypothetical protein